MKFNLMWSSKVIQVHFYILESVLRKEGYPAYCTSVGWIGYSDEKIKKVILLCLLKI